MMTPEECRQSEPEAHERDLTLYGRCGRCSQPTVNADELEAARAFWREVAEKNADRDDSAWGPLLALDVFPVQVWVNSSGHVVDSVSYGTLRADLILSDEERGDAEA